MYVSALLPPFDRVAETCDDRTTLVPYRSAGGAFVAALDPRNKNGPFPSLAVTASARRFMSAAYIAFRMSHAEGASTASGSFASICATSCGWNVSPFTPVTPAV